MSDTFSDPLALAQANFHMLRNVIKWLVIEGPLEVDRLDALMKATIDNANEIGHPAAADILTKLHADLMRPKARG